MNSAESIINQAISAQQAGNWKQALRLYNHAIDSHPRDAFPYQLRGALHLELNRITPALKDFDQAILLAPFNEVGYWGKGHVFMALKDYRWAVIQFTNAIDLVPESLAADYYRDRAVAYERLGDRVSAEKDRSHADTLDRHA